MMPLSGSLLAASIEAERQSPGSDDSVSGSERTLHRKSSISAVQEREAERLVRTEGQNISQE